MNRFLEFLASYIPPSIVRFSSYLVAAILTSCFLLIITAVYGLIFGSSCINIFGYDSCGRSIVPMNNMVAFFRDSCPEPWQPFAPLQGRYAVGAYEQKNIGESIGEKFVQDKENRPSGQHTHHAPTIFGSFLNVDNAARGPNSSIPPASVHSGVRSGNDIDRISSALTGGIALISADQALKDGTPAPYLLLWACAIGSR